MTKKHDSEQTTHHGSYNLMYPVFWGRHTEEDYQHALKVIAAKYSGRIVGAIVKVDAQAH